MSEQRYRIQWLDGELTSSCAVRAVWRNVLADMPWTEQQAAGALDQLRRNNPSMIFRMRKVPQSNKRAAS